MILIYCNSLRFRKDEQSSTEEESSSSSDSESSVKESTCSSDGSDSSSQDSSSSSSDQSEDSSQSDSDGKNKRKRRKRAKGKKAKKVKKEHKVKNWDLIHDWALNSRPPKMRNKKRVNRMKLEEVMAAFNLAQATSKANGSSKHFQARAKDTKLPTTKFKAAKDDGKKKLHKARWLQLPLASPAKHCTNLPLKEHQ